MPKSLIDKRIGNADEARLLPRYRGRAPLLAEQRRVLRRELRGAVEDGRPVDAPVSAGGEAGGDRRQLRAIPVVGARGVSGVIPGTHPELETISRDERRRR